MRINHGRYERWILRGVVAVILLGLCLLSYVQAGEPRLFLTLAQAADDKGNSAADEGLSPKLTPVQRGRGKAQLCTRCHGRLGMARAAEAREWPGTVEDFVVFNLTQFRSGKRVQAVMNAVAGPLSDEDIADVALWYQSMTPDQGKVILK